MIWFTKFIRIVICEGLDVVLFVWSNSKRAGFQRYSKSPSFIGI